MMDHVDDDPELSEVIRQQIVESDLQEFADSRQIVLKLLGVYMQLYGYILRNWNQLDRSVGEQPSTGMHG